MTDKQKDFSHFELPPNPPSLSFDVRFTSGRLLEKIDSPNKVKIQSASYPIKIKSTKYSLKLECEELQDFNEIITPEKDLIINDEKIKTLIISPVIVPNKTELYQNYPNPFNPITKVRFDLSTHSKVQLKLFDALGRELFILLDEEKNPGIYHYDLDAANLNLTSGVYFYQLTAGNYKSIKKMIYLK